VIWQLREENTRLHKTIDNLKQRSERDETDTSQCPEPLPRTHSLKKAAKRHCPVPTSRMSKSSVAQMSNQFYEVSRKPVTDKGMEDSADEEIDGETDLSSELSEMRIQPILKSRHV